MPQTTPLKPTKEMFACIAGTMYETVRDATVVDMVDGRLDEVANNLVRLRERCNNCEQLSKHVVAVRIIQ